VSPLQFYFFSVTCVSLTALNFLWFARMISSVAKRFEGKEDKDDTYGRFKKQKSL
jgi:hypothetical protein